MRRQNVDRKWKRLGLLTVALFLLGAVAVFFLIGPEGSQAPSVRPQEPSPAPREAQASATTDEPDLAGPLDLKVRPSELPATRQRTTNEDLLAKGFPMMSNPRKAAYTETAEQTTKEVVADLGNMFVLEYCRQNEDTLKVGDDLSYWSGVIPPNIKVLRLIEEGRKSPDAVGGLLRDSVTACLQSYDYYRQARADEWAAIRAGTRSEPVTSEDDPYYREHRTYESAIDEFVRLNRVVYMDFYTLASIGQLGPPQLLAEWFQKEKPWAYQETNFDVWLIDCYFKQVAPQAPPDEAGFAAKHTGLIGEAKISGSRIVESRWNASWDIHDWMLGAKNVNLSDIETIDVLEIPQSIPLDDDVKKQIIENFREYAKEAK
jgi:hypothetical protein